MLKDFEAYIMCILLHQAHEFVFTYAAISILVFALQCIGCKSHCYIHKSPGSFSLQIKKKIVCMVIYHLFSRKSQYRKIFIKIFNINWHSMFIHRTIVLFLTLPICLLHSNYLLNLSESGLHIPFATFYKLTVMSYCHHILSVVS